MNHIKQAWLKYRLDAYDKLIGKMLRKVEQLEKKRAEIAGKIDG